MCYNGCMKKIEIPNSLKELNSLFNQNGKKLYVVGGYIRNALLGFCETDIDICGEATYEEIKKFLKNSIFSLKLINEKLNTIHIKSKVSEEEFEYSPFRKEIYDEGGNHTPTKIEFITDIKQDMLRRDFSCNSIYYDLETNEIIDGCDGVKDVLEHKIRTVDLPQKTFDCDGLRILRMVRFCCELSFDIDENTFLVAREKISQLKDISQERFNKEIVSILFSDFKYDSIKNPNCPKHGLNLLCELGAFGYVFRQLAFEFGIEKLNEILKNAFTETKTNIPTIHRISAFCYEILKALDLEMNFENTEKVLGQNGLMLNKQEISTQAKILMAVEKSFDLKNDEIPLFVQQNSENIVRILDFLRLLNLGDNIRAVYKIMKEDNVPMSIRDLKINGDDLIKNFPKIKRTSYSKIFERLLKECCYLPELNSKENLLKYVRSNLND